MSKEDYKEFKKNVDEQESICATNSPNFMHEFEMRFLMRCEP